MNQLNQTNTGRTSMKLNTFYSAQKIVKELEDVTKIVSKIEGGARTVTLNFANMSPDLKKHFLTTLNDLAKRLEADLEKLK